MTSKVQHLVADAAAFISNAPLRDLAEVVYTVPEVIAESCDKETRRRFKMLPIDLTYREPSSESMKVATSFAKQTGDYGSLSSVDLKVLALTCDLAKQFQGKDSIKTEPVKKPAFVFGRSGGAVNAVVSQKELKDGDTLPSEMITEDPDNDETDESTGSVKEVDCGETGDMVAADGLEGDEEEAEDEKVSDDEGWITPSNIAEVKKSMGVEATSEKSVCVGCLTTDFAIQNVLIQMGLHVIAVDGKLIKQVRNYVLRCFGCMKITKDTTKAFCPHCGNKTLRRLSTSINEDGTVKYYLAKNYTVRTRGMKFSLPKPHGGKHALNPVLSADQRRPDQRPPKKSLQKVDIMSDDIVVGCSPFSVNDVSSRAAQLGLNHMPHWAKRNPNENSRKGNKRRKK